MLLVLAVALAFGQSERRNPFAGDKDAIEAGKGMFRIYCAPCHGIKAQGGRGPDLTLGVYTAGNRDQDLFDVVASGVSGTEMPGSIERFGDAGVWRLVAYIRSEAVNEPPPVTGAAKAGEKLFWGKGGCGNCHRAGARGNRSGPDLTLVGRQRSLAYLRESIVKPNASITPGYNTITVELKDGKKISGVQRGYDGFSAQFMDTSENFHSYFRDEVKSMTREVRSLMPDTYGKQFREREIDDLVAYLHSLRGGATR